MLDNIKVIPTRDRRFLVSESFEFNGVKIPEGFKTNGANIPRIFWIFLPPNHPEYLPASIIHDYMCDVAGGVVKDENLENLYNVNPVTIYENKIKLFYEADKLLYKAMLEMKCSKIKSKVFYCSVRVYHTVKYGKIGMTVSKIVKAITEYTSKCNWVSKALNIIKKVVK